MAVLRMSAAGPSPTEIGAPLDVGPTPPPNRTAASASSNGKGPGSAQPPSLLLTGVVKRWDPRRPPVLAGADLCVEPGTVVSISGANGTGKTTLLRIAAGLIIADEGDIRLQGLHPERNRMEFQRRLGFVAAGNSGLYARLTVDRHLDLWARLALLPRGQRANAIARAAQAFGLEELRTQRVDRLSMGQRQRLRLALAFLHEPELVLLDEPHTSLDVDGLAIVESALRALRARGGSAVLCWPSEEQVGEIHLDLRMGLVEGRLEAL